MRKSIKGKVLVTKATVVCERLFLQEVNEDSASDTTINTMQIP